MVLDVECSYVKQAMQLAEDFAAGNYGSYERPSIRTAALVTVGGFDNLPKRTFALWGSVDSVHVHQFYKD